MTTSSDAAFELANEQELPPSTTETAGPESKDSLQQDSSTASNKVPVPPREASRRNSTASHQREPSPIEKALQLVEDQRFVFFHTADAEAFVSVKVRDHQETYALKDCKFESFFAAQFWRCEGAVLSQNDFRAVRVLLIARAIHDGMEDEVFLRIGEKDGAIYLDLANDSWEAIKITDEGWEVVASPVRFRRSNGMKSLPHPARGGSIELLRRYVNVSSERDWKLLIGWLLYTYRLKGPFPVLALQGGQGSAKSTSAEVLRCLIDPNEASLRSAPQNVRDLMISANNSWCISFENLSSVPPWLSDALCRLASGAGFATRKLYTDSGEIVIEAARPILLNGIDVGIKNGDLLERTLMVTAPPIPSTKRITEADFWNEFEKDEPAILGALLDAVVCALKRLPEVKLPNLPRMADFMVWVTAAEPALGWREGEFLEAYSQNRQDVSELALENSVLTDPIECLLSTMGPWEGTATKLLGDLRGGAGADAKHQKSWPSTAGELSGMLRRLQPDLKARGINVVFKQTSGGGSKKLITITRTSDDESPRSESLKA